MLGEVKGCRHLRGNRISKRAREQTGRMDPMRPFPYLEGRCMVASHEIGKETDRQATGFMGGCVIDDWIYLAPFENAPGNRHGRVARVLIR